MLELLVPRLGWLQSSVNGECRDVIFRQLEGVKVPDGSRNVYWYRRYHIHSYLSGRYR